MNERSVIVWLSARMLSGAGSWLGFSFALGCVPSSDLDAHARESGADTTPEALPAREPGSSAFGADFETPAAPSTPFRDRPRENGSSEQSVVGGLTPPPPGPSDGADSGAPLVFDQHLADAAVTLLPTPSVVMDPPAVTVQTPPVVDAPALPDDLTNAPVAGEIVFSDEAVWEVDGVFEPTFEIHTPTASYWVVKPLGTIVSIEDAAPDAAQWISFSSGFRPLRGVPRFATPPVTQVTTVRDDESQTPTHLRLTATSRDGLWVWVWDFYVTHVTFTVNRAPLPFGFTYEGVPGGNLGIEDRLVNNDGGEQGARNSFNADLAGPVEWVYLADTTLRRSLFVMQHRDDTLPDRYRVRDNDTAQFSFGGGQLQALPQRFSLGLIASINHEAIAERVEFVANAIR